MLEGNVVHVG